mmetsp:Transcript_21194/g.24557  ORF Transcript_21194/g.24557 Transcript_21194/m.24557 type:complete len:826 (-) Transcript_21194:17-2494(-)
MNQIKYFLILSLNSLFFIQELYSFTISPIQVGSPKHCNRNSNINTKYVGIDTGITNTITQGIASSLFSSKASSRRKGSSSWSSSNDHDPNKKGFAPRMNTHADTASSREGRKESNQNDNHNHSIGKHQQLQHEESTHSNTHSHSNNKLHRFDVNMNMNMNNPFKSHDAKDDQIDIHHTAHQQQQHHRQTHQNRMSKILSHIMPPQAQTQTQHNQSNKNDNQKSNLPPLISQSSEWKKLSQHAKYIETTHLRSLLQDQTRSDQMYATHDGLYFDYTRQRITPETMDLLVDLAQKQNLNSKIQDMVNGVKINFTEDRAVLHTALRGKREDQGKIIVDGDDVMEEVYDVLDQIKYFTEAVRSGEIRGFTGKRLRNIISVGIGGSYLGPEFLHECLKTEPEGITKSLGYTLRFLSNVDPVDVERACADLDPEETLIVIVSKTFTTAETMLNARTVRQWLWDFMGDDKEVVRKHVVAVSSISSKEKVEAFGIDTEKYFFRFWDWVGGRYSVCSAVGGIPISLLYGYDLFEKFLQGAHSIDEHFINAPFKENIPVIMGLLGVWNMSFMGYNARTTLPYAEALLKLPAHIQQLDMESNGKKATRSGQLVDYPVGEIDFGEPGTNGQHSFFQLLHMGQVVPCEFIGFLRSQHDICIDGETVSAHDELMANFFAQPDALANGKTAEEVRVEGVDEDLIVHRTFEGNRPSLSIIAPKLTAYSCGQLLAIYEHRTAVQGFIWDINSFDQWGVELGKKLATDVKNYMIESRTKKEKIDAGNPATSRLLNYYVEESEQNPCETLWDTNPLTSVTRKTHREHFPPVGHDLTGHDGKLKF